MALPNHGANPTYLTRALGMDHPDTLIDFSVNTNPFGPPAFIQDYLSNGLTETVAAYPDPNSTNLANAISATIGVDPENLLIGNGAAELIFLVANVFRGKRVVIIEPAFSEYSDACQAYECEIRRVILPPPWQLRLTDIESYLEETDLLFLCTPNNPTGVSYNKDEVNKIIDAAHAAKTHIVIDEAFFDFSKNDHYLEEVKRYSNLLILRSLTKMYAIAGIRLGYIVANPTIIEKMKKRQAPWSVNGIAQKIGTGLLQETEFVRNSVKKLTEERERVTKAVQALDFYVSDSTVNFFLLYEKKQQNLDLLLRFLISRGIIARHTYNFNGLDGNYLRFAVKERTDNQTLIDALSEWRCR